MLGLATKQMPMAGAERQMRPWRGVALAGLVYGVLGVFANLPSWPGDPNRIRTGDLEQMVWYLAWTPHALVHGQNLFATTWLNYPEGVNLAQNTSAPLLGFLAMPLTLTAGPVSSLNLLLWLCFPLSALSMFVVLRRWFAWDLAAFVGGALYGFSPYVVTQSYDHLNLAFVPLPPLILLAAFELVRPGTSRPGRWGALLGLLVVAQFLVSPEIAATCLLVTALAGGVLAACRPRQAAAALRRARGGALVALGIVVAGVSYPIWVMTSGPYRYSGPAYPGGVSADLVGTIAPTAMQRFAPTHLRHEDAHLLFGHVPENGSYLGLPLLVLLAVLLLVCWRNRWVRFSAVMVVATTVLSLGPDLIVANQRTHIPLPWDLLQHLPFANNVIVARLSLYADLFAAVLVAGAMADLRVRWWAGARSRRDVRGIVAAGGPGVRAGWLPLRLAAATRSAATVVGTRLRGATLALLGLLGLSSLVTLIPAWPFATVPAAVPTFFTSAAAQHAPYGSVALISPYPSVLDVQPQMWQAAAGMRFRIIGGYALVRSALGPSADLPAALSPADVQRYLWAMATGRPGYPLGREPADNGALACATRRFLDRYHVDQVIVTSDGAEPAQVRTLVRRAIGPPSYVGGGVEAWFGVTATVDLADRTCGQDGDTYVALGADQSRPRAKHRAA